MQEKTWAYAECICIIIRIRIYTYRYYYNKGCYFRKRQDIVFYHRFRFISSDERIYILCIHTLLFHGLLFFYLSCAFITHPPSHSQFVSFLHLFSSLFSFCNIVHILISSRSSAYIYTISICVHIYIRI